MVEKNAIQERVLNFIDDLKKKTPVSITDLEEFYSMLHNVERSIEDLIIARDNWRSKYEGLKEDIITKRIKELTESRDNWRKKHQELKRS